MRTCLCPRLQKILPATHDDLFVIFLTFITNSMLPENFSDEQKFSGSKAAQTEDLHRSFLKKNHAPSMQKTALHADCRRWQVEHSISSPQPSPSWNLQTFVKRSYHPVSVPDTWNTHLAAGKNLPVRISWQGFSKNSCRAASSFREHGVTHSPDTFLTAILPLPANPFLHAQRLPADREGRKKSGAQPAAGRTKTETRGTDRLWRSLPGRPLPVATAHERTRMTIGKMLKDEDATHRTGAARQDGPG